MANCYVIMGAIHQQWVHIPSRWRDFITNPKSNFYQSIHTTIITREGVKFEIQIRTQEMHRNAEEGIAAHWKYKEGLAFLENDHRLEWFREMIDYHKTNPDPKEFLSLVKRDLTPNEIYVFTPKGKVVNLKAGASPDRLRLRHPLRGRRPLQERHRQRKAGAAAHAAELGRRGRDRHPEEQQPQRRLAEIRRHHPRQETDHGLAAEGGVRRDLEKGRRLWQKVLREYGRKYRLTFNDQDIDSRLQAAHYRRPGDLPAGRRQRQENAGPPDAEEPLPRSQGRGDPAGQEAPTAHGTGLHKLITVEGQADIDFTFAKCCHPIKGEEIIGYITKNRGLVIHRKTAPTSTAKSPRG